MLDNPTLDIDCQSESCSKSTTTMTLEDVQRDATSLVQQTQLASFDVERLKEQLAAEKKSVSVASMELEELKKELERTKNEAEKLRSEEQSLEDRRYARSKSRLELEDAKNTIAELREEIAYKSSVNRSLGLQLEKTIESNSELLLEIKDLDDLLQSREREIEMLKAEVQTSQEQPSYEAEKVAWMQSVEERELEIQELKGIISKLEETYMDKKHNRADGDLLKRDLEKMETELAEISKENMNLMSQLMELRHKTEEKEAMVKQLELKLQDQEGLEKKTKELQNMVNDLREKLLQSEELAQSQLDSNKLFLEELNATVEELRARNEQLEALQKGAEGRMACLIEELDAQRKENVEHEKEKSLLLSQRGQLKTLREKIATLTESYEAAKERVEGLEFDNRALQDENSKAIANLEQQFKDSQDKLHEVYKECADMKEKVVEAELRASEANGQISAHVTAKEIAEASVNSWQALHVELQEKFSSLLHEKEEADTYMHSLQAAHTQVQEEQRNVEQSYAHTVEQLQARDLEVTQLTESLEVIKGELQEAFEKLSESQSTVSAMEEELRRIKEVKENQSPHLEDLQLQISSLEEKLSALNESLLVSEQRNQTLQYQNDELAEMLRSSMSLQEEVACRLESIKIREIELERQLHEKAQALQALEDEKAAWDQALAELRDEVNVAEDGVPSSGGSTQEEEGPRKTLELQLGGLKASILKLKIEKERTESSLQQLQSDNVKLARELAAWKEKVEMAAEEHGLSKGKNRTGNEAINTVKAKRGIDSDLKSEVMKLRKLAADLRRKILEQDEEKEDIKKKLVLLQKEVQRKSDLLLVAEKKLKDRERMSQRTPTKYPPNTGRRLGTVDSSAPQGAKAMADLMERIKALEGELHIKVVELEAAKFVLKEREADLSGKPESNTMDHVDNCADVPLEEHQRLRDKCVNNGAVDTSKGESGDQVIKRFPLQWEGTDLEGELREMKERYSDMSLQFVELQAEREELLLTIKNLRRDCSK